MSTVRRITRVRLAVFSLLALATTTARASELCDAIRQLTDAAATGFSAIEGQARRNDRWQSRVTLPGFAGCEIVIVSNDRTLICYSSRLDDAQQAAALARSVSKQIAQCSSPVPEIIDNDIGESVMTMIMALDSRVTMGATTTPAHYDPLSQQFSQGWMMQFMMSPLNTGNERSTASTPTELEADEESTPAKFVLKEANLCSSLNKIITEGKKGFTGIRGSRAGDETTWRTTLRPEGAFDCDINELSKGDGKFYYKCKLLKTTAKESARQAFDQVNEAIATCLGGNWIAGRRKAGDDVRIEYSNEDHETRVQLELDELIGSWTVRIYVRAY